MLSSKATTLFRHMLPSLSARYTKQAAKAGPMSIKYLASGIALMPHLLPPGPIARLAKSIRRVLANLLVARVKNCYSALLDCS
jgi:hypothetical protein